MDTLVALGTSVAYFYSLGIIFAQIYDPVLPGRHFFETAAMLITFLVRILRPHEHARLLPPHASCRRRHSPRV